VVLVKNVEQVAQAAITMALEGGMLIADWALAG
jgi:hypothetical protein